MAEKSRCELCGRLLNKSSHTCSCLQDMSDECEEEDSEMDDLGYMPPDDDFINEDDYLGDF